MTALPNRISAYGQLTPPRELALARELLEIQSEDELDRFLPLLAAAAPLIANVAGPLLKNLAGGLFGGGGSGRKKRPQDQKEQFLGGIVKGLLGQAESESYEREQFLGKILKGALGGVLGGETETEMETEAETERLLGSLVGKLFGGEMESENYVQEQFLGGLLKGLIGGEMEAETGETGEMGAEAEIDSAKLMKRARRFVKLVNAAACHAAEEISQLHSTGHRPSTTELRRVVLASILRAAKQYIPRLAAAAFPGDGEPASPPQRRRRGQQGQQQGQQGQQQGQQGQTMLEILSAGATPMGGRRTNGYPMG